MASCGRLENRPVVDFSKASAGRFSIGGRVATCPTSANWNREGQTLLTQNRELQGYVISRLHTTRHSRIHLIQARESRRQTREVGRYLLTGKRDCYRIYRHRQVRLASRHDGRIYV